MTAGTSFPSVLVEHNIDRRKGTREFSNFISDDIFVLHVPLCRGRSTVTSNGKVVHDGLVFPGMLRMTSPGEKVLTVVNTTLEEVALRVPGSILREALSVTSPKHQPGDVSFVSARLQPDRRVEQLAREALRVGTFDPLHARLFVHGITLSLLAFILHHHQNPTLQNRKGKLDDGTFKKAVAFAEAHLESVLKIDAWASALGMSSPEFTRRFCRTTGYAPYAWFLERRIERSKELLLDRRNSLCDISMRIGFSSQSHFTDAFTRRVGLSPALWRKCQIP